MPFRSLIAALLVAGTPAVGAEQSSPEQWTELAAAPVPLTDTGSYHERYAKEYNFHYSFNTLADYFAICINKTFIQLSVYLSAFFYL